MTKNMDAGLKQAVAAVGGIPRLADHLGVTRMALYKWRRVPSHRIIEIEKITGVPREVLRPDLYRRNGK